MSILIPFVLGFVAGAIFTRKRRRSRGDRDRLSIADALERGD